MNRVFWDISVWVCVCVQESQSEVARLQKQKEELCAQIRDLSLPVDLASESLPDLKKQLRLLESQAGERAEEITALTGKIQQQQQVLTENTFRHTFRRRSLARCSRPQLSFSPLWQIHMRFEMEMERMKQIHQKELEDKEEELEDVHKSSQRRVGRHYSSGEKVDEGPDSKSASGQVSGIRSGPEPLTRPPLDDWCIT